MTAGYSAACTVIQACQQQKKKPEARAIPGFKIETEELICLIVILFVLHYSNVLARGQTLVIRFSTSTHKF